MTFREFLQLKEQGTDGMMAGPQAAGRLGQNPMAPAKPVTKGVGLNKKGKEKTNVPKQVSAFNVSSKTVTNAKRDFGPLNAGGTEIPDPKLGDMSPRGLGFPNAIQALSPSGVPALGVKIPKPGAKLRV